MKMNKKKTLVAALAVSLIAILSLGTIAWFNATDEITNTFKVADSDGDGTPDFSVDVWEGTATDKDQDGIIYDRITPGDVLAKNPTVENTGDYDQWVRVYVTFDEYATIKAACEAKNLSTDLTTWLDVDSNSWTKGTETPVVENNTITYVYYYNYKLVEDGTAVLFNKVTIPSAFEQEDMQFVSNNFTIKVKAEAIQADNNGETAQAGFANWTY